MQMIEIANAAAPVLAQLEGIEEVTFVNGIPVGKTGILWISIYIVDRSRDVVLGWTRSIPAKRDTKPGRRHRAPCRHPLYAARP